MVLGPFCPEEPVNLVLTTAGGECQRPGGRSAWRQPDCKLDYGASAGEMESLAQVSTSRERHAHDDKSYLIGAQPFETTDT